jgi:hypothetical protein
VNKFIRVAGYKIDIQKSDPIIYADNEQFKIETKKNPIYSSIKNKI